MNLMLNGIEAMKDTAGEPTIKSELGHDGQLLISVRTPAWDCLPKKPTKFSMRSLRQAAGLRHGTGHQPLDRQVAWWPPLGHFECRSRRGVLFHTADRGDGVLTLGHLRQGGPITRCLYGPKV